MVSTLELRCAAEHSTENVQNVRVWNLKWPAQHWQLPATPPAPGLAFHTAEQPLQGTALLAEVLPLSKTESCSQCKRHMEDPSVCFSKMQTIRTVLWSRHFLLKRQITIKSFLDAIMLQDKEDYKQPSPLPISKINIQLYDLRDLALDKAPFEGTCPASENHIHHLARQLVTGDIFFPPEHKRKSSVYAFQHCLHYSQ